MLSDRSLWSPLLRLSLFSCGIQIILASQNEFSTFFPIFYKFGMINLVELAHTTIWIYGPLGEGISDYNFNLFNGLFSIFLFLLFTNVDVLYFSGNFCWFSNLSPNHEVTWGKRKDAMLSSGCPLWVVPGHLLQAAVPLWEAQPPSSLSPSGFS